LSGYQSHPGSRPSPASVRLGIRIVCFSSRGNAGPTGNSALEPSQSASVQLFNFA